MNIEKILILKSILKILSNENKELKSKNKEYQKEYYIQNKEILNQIIDNKFSITSLHYKLNLLLNKPNFIKMNPILFNKIKDLEIFLNGVYELNNCEYVLKYPKSMLINNKPVRIS